jgi:hypothetical protein
MSYSQRRYAHILELNGQPLNPHQPRLLRRTASGHLFDPANPTMLSQPQAQKPVEAMILDLSGNPIRCGESHPLLRRTVSGNLFQSNPSHVPQCELQEARSVTPDSPDTASAMVPQRLEHKLPPPLPTSASASITRKHADKQLDMHVTLLAAPAKQAHVVEAKSNGPLGRPHSMVAMTETASPKTPLHSSSSYHDECAEANSCRSTIGERNIKLMTASATPYALRHVAQTSDLHEIYALQIVPHQHAAHTGRSGPIIAESQNPNGICQGYGLATYAEHERFRRQREALIAEPVTPRPVETTLPTALPLPSPTATAVCGAEEYAIASACEGTATEVGAREKVTRPWSEDIWMQVARE